MNCAGIARDDITPRLGDLWRKPLGQNVQRKAPDELVWLKLHRFMGAWRAHYTPKLKKRTALLRKLKDVFRRYQSQPVHRVGQLINPMLQVG